MPIPIILDTDIGIDIDDTWALGFLLKSPEIDLRLAVSATGDTTYRARLLARFLQLAGRSDVPVGVGLATEQPVATPQADWVAGYQLDDYPGQVHTDGVQALIEALLSAPEPVTLLCIGPLTNIAAALQREPHIAQHARLVGMYGSLRLGYDGRPNPEAEWNVLSNPAACQAAFAAPWPVTITPVDTCGLVRLTGAEYQRVRQSNDPVARMVIENERIWRQALQPDVAEEHGNATHTSILFDTVAAYLAFSEDLLEMETLGVRVNDEGFTRLDPAGCLLHCATAWKDLPAFRRLLVERLAGPEIG